VLYVLLGLYIDQVFPKDTGVAKHPLFCCKKSEVKKNRYKDRLDINSMLSSKLEYIEEVAESLQAQSINNTTLEIKGLKKVYKNKKVAVNDLNVTLYSD
jgi:hypothetical protein